MKRYIFLSLFIISSQCLSAQYAISFSAGMEVIDHGTQVKNYEATIFNTDKFFNYGFGLRYIQNSTIRSGDLSVTLAHPYYAKYNERGQLDALEGLAMGSIKIKGLRLTGYAGYCLSYINTTGSVFLFEQNDIVETLTYDKEYESIIYPRLGLGLEYEIKLFGNISLVPKFQYLNDLKSQQNGYRLLSNNEVASDLVDDLSFQANNPSTRNLFHESKYLFANIGLTFQL